MPTQILDPLVLPSIAPGIPGTVEGVSGPPGADGAAGPAGSSGIFVYRAGDTPSGNVFDTFQGAYDAAFALNAPATIVIDDTITSCIIPTDSGNFDLHQIALSGVGNSAQQNFLSIYDNTSFNQGMPAIINGLILSFYGNTNSLCTFSGPINEYTIIVDNYAAITNASSDGYSIYDLTVNPVSVIFHIDNTSCVGITSNPIFNLGNQSSGVLATVGDYCFIYNGSFAGTNGSVNINIYTANSGDASSFSYPNFTGSLSVNLYSDSVAVRYGPESSSNWDFTGSSGAPTTVTAALDSIASGLNQVSTHIIDGVSLSGTPATGSLLIATDASNASWQPPTLDGVGISGTPSAGQVLTATDAFNATWQAPSLPSLNVIQGYMSAQSTNINPGDHLMFTDLYVSIGVDIVLDGSSPYDPALGVASVGRITLQPNHTYKLTFNANQAAGAGDMRLYWRDANTGHQISLITSITSTGSYGDIIGYYPVSGSPALVELYIANNNGITSIGIDLLPWFTIEEIA